MIGCEICLDWMTRWSLLSLWITDSSAPFCSAGWHIQASSVFSAAPFLLHRRITSSLMIAHTKKWPFGLSTSKWRALILEKHCLSCFVFSPSQRIAQLMLFWGWNVVNIFKPMTSPTFSVFHKFQHWDSTL